MRRGCESEVSHEMAAGAHGDVRSRRVPCERRGGDGVGHRATTAPDGTAVAQDRGIEAMALTESLGRTDTRACSVLSRCPENEEGARQLKLGPLTSLRLSQRRRLQ